MSPEQSHGTILHHVSVADSILLTHHIANNISCNAFTFGHGNDYHTTRGRICGANNPDTSFLRNRQMSPRKTDMIGTMSTEPCDESDLFRSL